LCWHEIDVAERGGIEHRLLFHRRGDQGVCVTVRCRSMEWKRVPRPSGRLRASAERYPGAPDTGK
jgi:hypothetical protein